MRHDPALSFLCVIGFSGDGKPTKTRRDDTRRVFGCPPVDHVAFAAVGLAVKRSIKQSSNAAAIPHYKIITQSYTLKKGTLSLGKYMP